MASQPSRFVRLDPSPEVQILGDAAVLRGAAALDAYRVMCEGIALVLRRDGIPPSRRLEQTVAALKAAATTSRITSADTSDIADVRKQATSAQSVKTGEQVGIEEVARMCGVGTRQARRLAPELGGHKTSKGWRCDRGMVQRYIEMEGRLA